MESNQKFYVVRDHPTAVLPKRGSADAAGLDVCAVLDEEITLGPLDRVLISTGCRMQCPQGTYIRAAPRSGLAYKNGIHVMAGVIDIDYTGIVGIILVNLGSEPFTIKSGDRIAQIILTMISMADPEDVSHLPETDRGPSGFGSTGTQ